MRSPVFPVSLFIGLITFTIACGRSEPCVDCPDVAGVYEVTIESRQLAGENCSRFTFPGETGLLTLAQDGSDLTLVELGVGGTLFDDDSAFFDPYTITGHGYTASVTWSASFVAQETGGWTIQGYLSVNIQGEDCHVLTPFRGEQR
jgi:hypothetical protein